MDSASRSTEAVWVLIILYACLILRTFWSFAEARKRSKAHLPLALLWTTASVLIFILPFFDDMYASSHTSSFEVRKLLSSTSCSVSLCQNGSPASFARAPPAVVSPANANTNANDEELRDDFERLRSRAPTQTLIFYYPITFVYRSYGSTGYSAIWDLLNACWNFCFVLFTFFVLEQYFVHLYKNKSNTN